MKGFNTLPLKVINMNVRILIPAISVLLLSCGTWEKGRDGTDNLNRTLTSPIYKVNEEGKVVRDRRMERVLNRGCVDSTVDCRS